MKPFLASLLLLCVITPQTFALSLDQAIEAALQNHQRIEQSRANADQSKATVGISRAAFYPRVDLDYSYSKRDEDPRSLGDQSSILILGASLNLFNGLSDYHSYRAASQRAQGADYLLQGTRADILLETQQAYIEVLRSNQSVKTATEGVELLERQRRDAQLQFDYGLIARNDLLRVEVELSNARQELLQAEGRRQIALRQLERTTGLQLALEEGLEDLTATALQRFDPLQVDSYRLQMLENRSELLFLRSELQATKRDRQANRGDYLPELDLTVAHERFSDDISTTGDSDHNNLLLLHANWNLFDGFAREEKIIASEARTRAVAAELRDTEAALVLQLETALQNARIASGRLQEAQTGVTQAIENYRVTENRFQQQQATTVDLLDAQFLLTRSHNLEIDARYDLFLSSAQLERILEQGKDYY